MPKDGWQTRWFIQAAALLLQSPGAILTGLLGLVLISMLDLLIAPLFHGLWAYVVYSSLISAIAISVPISVCRSLSLSESYGATPIIQMTSGLKIIAVTILFINSITVSIAVILLLFQISLGEVPTLPERYGIEAFLDGGITAVGSALFSSILVNALWSPLITQMPMSFDQVRLTGVQMITKCFHVWSAIIIVTALSAHATLIISPVISSIILIYLSAWHYVAAREIFGGISSNKFSMEVKTSLMEA